MIFRRFPFAALIPVSLALAACGGKDPAKDENPTPPDLAANFSGPIDGQGATGWSLHIRGIQLTVAQPGQPDLTGVAPGGVITPHTASWTAKLPDGQLMTVKLYSSPCSVVLDGPSFPMAAEVDLPGSSPLSGCAGPASVAAPRPTPAKS